MILRLVKNLLRFVLFGFLCALFWNEFVQAETPVTVERGLQYFRTRLDSGLVPGDGAFQNDCGITALVGMAFLASGSTPLEGPDAPYIQKCIEILLKNVHSDGSIASKGATEQGRVYSHGFAVTFLAECLGMSFEDEKLREVLVHGVTLIVQAQGVNGGWRYSFQPGEEDVSVTACFLTALRACRNAGIPVPAECAAKGISYLLKCQNTDGGFRYRLPEGPSAFPRSAAAVAGLCAVGSYDSPEIRQAIEYLKKTVREPKQNSLTDGYYFYAQYYAVQAFRLTDFPQELWDSWFVQLTETLEQAQKPNGSWISTISLDYATAMALIVLQAETNFLPIFQK